MFFDPEKFDIFLDSERIRSYSFGIFKKIRNKKSYSENGGARNDGMPQASRLTWHWRWAYWVLHIRRRDTVMATAAATNDKVRN